MKLNIWAVLLNFIFIMGCDTSDKTCLADLAETQLKLRDKADDEAIAEADKLEYEKHVEWASEFNSRQNQREDTSVKHAFVHALINAKAIDPDKGSFCLNRKGEILPNAVWQQEGDIPCYYEDDGEPMVHVSYGTNVDGEFYSSATMVGLIYVGFSSYDSYH